MTKNYTNQELKKDKNEKINILIEHKIGNNLILLVSRKVKGSLLYSSVIMPFNNGKGGPVINATEWSNLEEAIHGHKLDQENGLTQNEAAFVKAKAALEEI